MSDPHDINEVTRKILAVMRSHYRGTPFQDELRAQPEQADQLWVSAFEKVYKVYVETEEMWPQMRMLEGGR